MAADTGPRKRFEKQISDIQQRAEKLKMEVRGARDAMMMQMVDLSTDYPNSITGATGTADCHCCVSSKQYKMNYNRSNT